MRILLPWTYGHMGDYRWNGSARKVTPAPKRALPLTVAIAVGKNSILKIFFYLKKGMIEARTFCMVSLYPELLLLFLVLISTSASFKAINVNSPG